MSTNDGGSAFPSSGVVLHDGRQQGAYEGMALRDYFAAKAMQAQLSNPANDAKALAAAMNNLGLSDPTAAVCRVAYTIADAMLKERAK